MPHRRDNNTIRETSCSKIDPFSPEHQHQLQMQHSVLWTHFSGKLLATQCLEQMWKLSPTPSLLPEMTWATLSFSQHGLFMSLLPFLPISSSPSTLSSLWSVRWGFRQLFRGVISLLHVKLCTRSEQTSGMSLSLFEMPVSQLPDPCSLAMIFCSPSLLNDGLLELDH